MMTECILEDEELGRLLVRVNIRARRLTFRTREDAVYVTVPPGTTVAEVRNAVEQLRPRLRVAQQKQSRPLIDLNYRIDTEFFKLSLVSGERDRFLSRSELGEMQIICPPHADFSNKELQALDGTIEKIELKPDLSGTIGEGKLLFRASESPWSREKDADGKDKPNKVTDGPYLFRTGTGRLGMIWTSWIYNVYTQGVAYSESGTLDGPWIQEKDPITPPNFGHGMLFQTLDGKWLMSVHSHKDVNGRYIRIPRLFEVDFSGDKLMVGKPYIP